MKFSTLFFLFILNTSWAQEFSLYSAAHLKFPEKTKQIKIIDSANFEIKTYLFSKDGQPISYSFYRKGNLSDSIINYFEQGKIVKTNHYDAQKQLINYKVFEYDSNGLLARADYYEGKFFIKKEYKYKDGKLFKVKERNSVTHYTDKYSYRMAGLTTRRKYYKGITLVEVGNMFKSDTLEYAEDFRWQLDSTVPHIKTKSVYDKQGRKIQRFLYNDGEEIDKHVYHYSYNILTSEDEYFYGKLIGRRFFDEKGNLTCWERLDKDQFYIFSLLEYQFNSRGTWVKRFSYGNAGLKNIVTREIEYWD